MLELTDANETIGCLAAVGVEWKARGCRPPAVIASDIIPPSLPTPFSVGTPIGVRTQSQEDLSLTFRYCRSTLRKAFGEVFVASRRETDLWYGKEDGPLERWPQDIRFNSNGADIIVRIACDDRSVRRAQEKMPQVLGILAGAGMPAAGLIISVNSAYTFSGTSLVDVVRDACANPKVGSTMVVDVSFDYIRRLGDRHYKPFEQFSSPCPDLSVQAA